MAQQFVHYTLKRSPVERRNLEMQLNEIRKENEFSDCDEKQLIDACDEMERAFNRRKKRKGEPMEEQFTGKRIKLDENQCKRCDKKFSSEHALKRHWKSHFMHLKCGECRKTYSRLDSFRHHQKKCEKGLVDFTSKCNECKHECENYQSLLTHIEEQHPFNQSGGRVDVQVSNNLQDKQEKQKDGEAMEVEGEEHRDNDSVPNDLQEKQKDGEAMEVEGEEHRVDEPLNIRDEDRVLTRRTALNDTVSQVDLKPFGDEKYDLLRFMANVKSFVLNEIQNNTALHLGVKFYVNVKADMYRQVLDEKEETITTYFRSKVQIALSTEEQEHHVNVAYQEVHLALENFLRKGSNWNLQKVICMELHMAKYSLVAGSSYMELPSIIRNTNSVINIQNDDNKCFLWSILAALHPE